MASGGADLRAGDPWRIGRAPVTARGGGGRKGEISLSSLSRSLTWTPLSSSARLPLPSPLPLAGCWVTPRFCGGHPRVPAYSGATPGPLRFLLNVPKGKGLGLGLGLMAVKVD